MSNLITLIKISLKSGSNFSNGKKTSKSKSVISIFALAFLMVIGFGVPMGNLVSSMYDTFATIGQEGIILALLMVTGSLMIFVFGIVYVLGTFYFSKDIEYLIPLPLKPWEITMSKFVTVLIYEYMTEAIFILIPLISFGVKSGAGIAYWIITIVVLVVLPIFPLSIAAIINIVLMSFTNLGKHRDKLRVLGGILSMFLAIGLNVFIGNAGKTMNGSQEQIIAMINSGKNSFISVITNYVPTAKLSALSLANSSNIKSLYYMLGLLGITVLALLIFGVLANALYFKGALGGQEVSSKRVTLKKGEFEKATKGKSIILSYAIKEIKLLFRTPAYLMNCVISSFLWPIFMLIPLMSGFELSELPRYIDLIKHSDIDGIILAVGVSVIFFIAASNLVSATAISREGSNVFFMKYIPLSYEKQIISKVLPGMILSLISIIFLIVISVILKMNFIFIISFLVLSIIASLAANFISILVDLGKPKLHWDNEQVAVKQNFRSMVSFFGCLIIAGANVIAFMYFEPSFLITSLALLVEMTAISIISYKIICKKSDEYFDYIE